MREIKTHNYLGEPRVKIVATDEPSFGGANHRYEISLLDGSKVIPHCVIDFQKGPVKEQGINGLFDEVLLAIVQDRFYCFQNNEFTNRDTAIALERVEEALYRLFARTQDRTDREVEGTSDQ